MTVRKPLLIGLATCLLSAPLMARAYEADWKRGQDYFRMVCTECHKGQPCGVIAPNSLTRAEWTAYLEADKHAKGKDSFKTYLGKPFRASIAGTNKAVAKFADVPDEALYEDLRAFVMRSAKDGDTPTGSR